MQLNDPRFSADMVSACAAAMDSGLHHISDIKQFVMDAMTFAPIQTDYLGEIVVDVVSHEDFYGVQGRLQERIAQSPRGTYATGKLIMADEDPTFRAYIADGHGLAAGVKDRIFMMRPGASEIVDLMITHEIIECKKAIEQERKRLLNVALLKELDVQVGQDFTKYYARGVKYASATILGMDAQAGTVHLRLVNPMLPGQSETTIDALDFVSNAGIQTKAMLAQRKKDFPLIMNARTALSMDLTERAAQGDINNTQN